MAIFLATAAICLRPHLHLYIFPHTSKTNMTLGNLDGYSTCGISVSFRQIAISQQKWKSFLLLLFFNFRKPYVRSVYIVRISSH